MRTGDTKMIIPIEGRELVLIGTAHVSRESIDEVRNIILEEKPALICVELDKGRYASMTQKDTWEKLDMVKVFREGKGFLLLANLVLSGFQRRMGAELGVKPGEEMKAALDLADELGIPHALCDREVQITLRRAWANCGLWNKNKLLAALLASAFTTEKLEAEEIEELKTRSELDGMMEELASYLPEVKETLIDERDEYLASKIYENMIAKVPPAEPARRIVAVVGAGHMQGMRNHLEKISKREKSADVSALDTIPPRGKVSKILPFLIPIIILSLIVFGFIRGGADLSLSMLRTYVLWNGSLAALGSILALSHPLAILAAFIFAPITTFTPFIGVGLFSGAIQAVIKKPRVTDAQNLIDDTASLRGFYRNRITRALLVFFLTQLGGAVGTFVTIPAMAAELLAR
ncbi:MAG: TraB/GumN family protein [Treponema sp.]|nr:TraB/GumN family protein [Treponema sp.]